MADKNTFKDEDDEDVIMSSLFKEPLDEAEADILDIEKSAEILYNGITRQYKLEMESFDTLKDKANGIIVSCGTLITLITLATIQLLNSNVIKTFFMMNIFIFFLLVPYICFIVSIVLAVKSYFIVELKTVNAQELLKEYYRNHKVKILEQLSSNIASYVEKNKTESKKRRQFINFAMLFLMIGVVSFAIILFIIFSVVLLA